MPRSIDPRLMQAYAELPDLTDIKTCIDTTTDEVTSYVKQITFIVKEELESLWLRICGLQASAGELAYMYAYLALAGYCTMTNRANLAGKSDLLAKILGPKACMRHATIAANLLDWLKSEDRIDDLQNQIDPLQTISQHPYDFRNLANCPPFLLRCCTQLQLLSYHWHAHHYKEAHRFSLQAVDSARRYRLFALVEAADRQRLGLVPIEDLTQEQWNTPQLRFVAGLRRLHFELSALVHMCTFPLMVPVSLTAEELCKDKGDSNSYGAEDLRVPIRQYSQAAKMERAQLKSIAVSKLLNIEATDFESLSWNHEQSTRGDQMNWSTSETSSYTHCNTARELRIQAYTKLDLEVQEMILAQKVSVEAWADMPSWRSKPVNDSIEAAYTNFTLYKRFDRNRIRFELLARLVGSHAYVPALQGLAMEAAMDTLLLLGKALLMLQSSWAITGWLVWLEDQVNAAIHLFNHTIMHQVSIDAHNLKESGTHHKGAGEASVATFRGIATAREAKDFGLAATISKTQASDAAATSENTTDSNQRMEEKKSLEILYPDKTGILFSQFIFSFNSLFKVLEDLHILPPAAFEAARILKRLKVPRSPRLEGKTIMTEEKKASIALPGGDFAFE